VRYKVRVEHIEPGKARLTITMFDEDGNPTEQTRFFKSGDDIAKVTHEDRLRPLGTVGIEGQGSTQVVLLTNTSLRLAEGQEWEYTPEGFGSQARERLTQVRADRHPVFNLIDRAAKQTGLTRPTINAIFRRLRDERKAALLTNPEGFASVFIAELRNALADHITSRIEFVVEPGEAGRDKDDLFPPTRRYPQKEVLDAGEHGLYDLVQKDSGVEQDYVEAIKAEHDAIVFYFKFPPGFKVDLPALIGNYNPDWGVARICRNGAVEVRTFVHETKGTTEIGKLQFPHEKRKIRCAEKYFAAIGVNYRPIDPKKVGGWWEMVEQAKQLL
jgi:type III restriction enzyme